MQLWDTLTILFITSWFVSEKRKGDLCDPALSPGNKNSHPEIKLNDKTANFSFVSETLSNMSIFTYSEGFTVTQEIKESFRNSGFVVIKNLFSEAEVSKLINFYENSPEIQKHAYGRDDGLNKKTKVNW